MSPPLVSIIVPSYNVEAWLRETIENALAQTWQSKEVIIVNDGSTDGTLAIAQRYQASQVRIFSQANGGLSAARNAGLREAQGDYIQFLDADDLISPDKIERQVELLESSPPRMLATGRWGRFRRDPTKARFGSSPYWRDLEPLDYLARVARTGNSIPVHAWLLPRSVADATGPFSPELRLMEDQEYFARAVLASAGLRFCAQGCSYYRSFHAHSLSKERQATASSAKFRAVELVASHLQAGAAASQARQIAADYYQWLAFALYPERPDLVRLAEQRVQALGGSDVRPLMGRRARALARIIGWKLVQRLRSWLWRRGVYLSKHDLISD